MLDDGRGTPSGCPNNPRVREFVHGWIDAAIDTGADRIFCDEPHWVHPEHFGLDPERWGCRCEHCRERFGREFPVRARRPRCSPSARTAWSTSSATSWPTARARARRSTVCLLPLTGGVHGISDWSRGGDAARPAHVRHRPVLEGVRRARRGVRGRVRAPAASSSSPNPQLWIQGFRLEPDDVEDIHAAVRVAREAGIDDLWTWGFEACGHMSALRGSDSRADLGGADGRAARPGGGGPMRLGVEAALVDGQLLPGDVEIDGGAVVAVGLGGAGRGIAAPGLRRPAGQRLRRRRPDGRRPRRVRARGRGAAGHRHDRVPADVRHRARGRAARGAARRCRTNGIGPRVLGAHVEGPVPVAAPRRRARQARPVARRTSRCCGGCSTRRRWRR